MTTADRYHYRLPSYAYTCTDCGALVLDTAIHDTWHLTENALRIGPNDHLILTADLDLDDAQRLENLVRRAGLTGRVTVIHPDLNPRIVNNPTPTPCPDCDHNSTDHGGRHGCAYRRYKAAICGCRRTTW